MSFIEMCKKILVSLGFGLVLSCKMTGASPDSASLESTAAVPAIREIASASLFHTNISNAQRLALLAQVRIEHIMSAPGHAALRNPSQIVPIAAAIKAGTEQGFREPPILIGVFTDEVAGVVKVRSVEVLDGNHRLAAGLYSGKWITMHDIPQGYVTVRVNGWEAGGVESLPRWIPLEVAEASSIPKDQWFRVPDDWGPKAPSAQIPGSIASIDAVIPTRFRGVTMREVLALSLAKIGR